MRIPYSVFDNLTEEDLKIWDSYYKEPSAQIDRKIEEGIWRRTQCFENKEESCWKDPSDSRRRMLQYKHQFDLLQDSSGKSSIALVDTYLWIHYCLPIEEANVYLNKITTLLNNHDWIKIEENDNYTIHTKGDLCYKVTCLKSHDEDLKEGRTFPDNYRMFEITFYSKHHTFSSDFIRKPWEVLRTGIRKKELRQEGFHDINLEEIPKYFPAQVELGCGASIEAGIPPLNFLHKVYNVTDHETNQFILSPSKDQLPFILISQPELKTKEMTFMFRQCFKAAPTDFYHVLKDLYSKGYIVGDIITNNFDGLIQKIGLPERYVRRYDEANIIPKINFHEEAKSLIVIGSHADRRKIQQAARQKGLKLIYLDPEGYDTPNGFIDYPLESLKENDIYLKAGATESLKRISNALENYKEMETLV